MTQRTPTVTLAARMTAMEEPIQTPSGAIYEEASQRLLELHRLLDAALPAVELFGDLKTLAGIKQELGL
jgi:hypothetical protein